MSSIAERRRRFRAVPVHVGNGDRRELGHADNNGGPAGGSWGANTGTANNGRASNAIRRDHPRCMLGE